MSDEQSSKALVRKRPSDMALMPPPPQVKKIKRPKKVLDEDTYTLGLSQIIARDFFPGLLETETQQEYLDALESKDAAWISSVGRRLQHVMTPGRDMRTPSRLATPVREGIVDGKTPTTYVGDTPVSVARTIAVDAKPAIDINMSLSQYQSTYTSEDNESFYKLVDKQNQKKAEKYSWIWHENRLPSKQMIKQKEVKDRLAQTRSLIDDGFSKKDRLAISDGDDRPAMADTWKLAPKNTLMFAVEGVDDEATTVAEMAERASRMGPKTINYANTRAPKPDVIRRPPSPTSSSIQHAVSGDPRQRYADSSITGGETPRVNGYTFVDDEDDDGTGSVSAGDSPSIIDLGPGDTNNPFKIQDQRKRETLHERMVERIARSNKESSRHDLSGKARNLATPKFASSPRVSGGLTPAAQRLWSNMGTPRRSMGNSFGQPTPKKPMGSLLSSVKRPPQKD